MPKLSDREMKELLAEGKLTAISIDTGLFDEKRLQLNSKTLRAFTILKEGPFDFILSGTVAREVLAHLKNAAVVSLNCARKGIGKALRTFDTHEPQGAWLLEKITHGKTCEEAANACLDQYIADTGCELLDDTILIDTETLFESYFEGKPPFGPGKKKFEFPDALALFALERKAVDRGAGIMVVSKDGDWGSFCEASENLYLVPEIERALALIMNAPPMLKKTILAWAQGEEDGAAALRASLEAAVRRFDFQVMVTTASGMCDLTAWAATPKDLTWPDERCVDIIDYKHIEEDESISLTVSLPLTVAIEVPVEVGISLWDDIDKKSVSIGGRTIDVDQEICATITASVNIRSLGTKDEDIIFVEADFDDNWFEMYLDEANVFVHLSGKTKIEI